MVKLRPQCVFATLLLVATSWTAFAQPPGYYNGTAGLTGTALRNALHDIIDNHTVIPYSGSSFDARDGVDLLQQDPNNSNNVILLYSGVSVAKSTWPGYNREHVWPQSLGVNSGPPNSDMHNIFACDANVNSARGNKYFDDCTSGCSTHPEAPQCSFTSSVFEPRDQDKGDVARVLFYMDVRYNGDVSGEPDLVLTNTPGVISSGCDCMGLLDVLLTWHALDPVDAKEIARNNAIYSQIQGNRNPFVDDPTWVSALYGGGPPPPPPPPPPGGGIVWINEIHYDNTGSDTQEGIEIAGVAGTDLSGMSFVLYNGNGGSTYDTEVLSGVISDQQNGFGTVWFPIAGIQNGAPDGIALVDSAGDIVQFVGYEGTHVAANGPAAGMTTVDIGVSESSGTPVGESLQLTGTGNDPADFTWVSPASHTRAGINNGQSFTPLTTEPQFARGDCNGDGGNDISDPAALLGWLFLGDTLSCLAACDRDDDGAVNLADVVSILNALFSVSAPPAPPFPACGVDPTADLGCGSFDGC
ncbi:MAG: endonuclease [Planctomycetota bacterium]